MSSLLQKHCTPQDGTAPLTPAEIAVYQSQLVAPWKVLADKKITKQFGFGSYDETMAAVNAIAAIAKSQNHHPDMTVHYSNIEVELSTHSVGGLSDNDFILAAKIDEALA